MNQSEIHTGAQRGLRDGAARLELLQRVQYDVLEAHEVLVVEFLHLAVSHDRLLLDIRDRIGRSLYKPLSHLQILLLYRSESLLRALMRTMRSAHGLFVLPELLMHVLLDHNGREQILRR